MVGKRAYICSELGDTCTWPKQFFLNLVGDQRLDYEIKYENPGQLQICGQTLLLSNTGVPWTDCTGEIQRRIVPFYFGTSVNVRDLSLQKRVMKELPRIFVKGVQSYQALLGDVQADGLDLEGHLNHLAPSNYFARATDAMFSR
jgi:phage/plasmid-associated DNA primase